MYMDVYIYRFICISLTGVVVGEVVVVAVAVVGAVAVAAVVVLAVVVADVVVWYRKLLQLPSSPAIYFWDGC